MFGWGFYFLCMKLSTIFLGAVALVSTSTSIFLYQENQELQAKQTIQPTTQPEAQSCPEPKTVYITKQVPASQAANTAPVTAATQPTEEPRDNHLSSFQDYADRKNRRQERMSSFLGRQDGETDEEYRARMTPLITFGLAGPRKLFEEGKENAFSAANVSKEQRSSLDTIVGGAYDEAIDLVNRSITSGEISPYERNPSALLNLAGSMGAVLEDTQNKINQVLTPEQQKTMAETGFDWAEYLGVNAPWETLSPPPPPKK
jgi:hypothetical protein